MCATQGRAPVPSPRLILRWKSSPPLPEGFPMRRLLLLLALLSPLVTVIGRGLTAEADRKPPFYADKANLLVYLDDAGRPVPVKSADEWQQRRGHVLANMQLVMGPL